MRNKIIIIVSAVLVLLTIVIVCFNRKDTTVDTVTINNVNINTIKETTVGLYDEDNRVIDRYGNDVTDNPKGYNSMMVYKTGCEFRPSVYWYTDTSCSPEDEVTMANALQNHMPGYVVYKSMLLTEEDNNLYEPIFREYGSADLLFYLYTVDGDYIACRIRNYIYYYNIEDNIVHNIELEV